MPEYPLTLIETPDMPLDWRVEKMRLSKDKTQIEYNDFLTLDGIPSKALAYRLGNRSALEWIIDQYRWADTFSYKECSFYILPSKGRKISIGTGIKKSPFF